MAHTWDDEKDRLFGGDASGLPASSRPAGLTAEDFETARREIRKKKNKGEKVPGLAKRGRRYMSATDTRDLTQDLATRHLSPAIGGDRRLTPSDVRVLAILVMDATKSGSRVTDMSVPEIANRAAVSHRQVQLSAQKLGKTPFHLVERTHRPLRPGMNDTNIYRIDVLCFARRACRSEEKKSKSSPRRRGEKNSGVKNNKLDYISSTSTNTQTKKKNGCRKSGLPGVVVAKSRQDREQPVRKQPPVRLNETQASIAKRALAILEAGKSPPDASTEIVETIERLRSKELYAFNEDAWPVVLRRQGANAYLAVVETLLMARVRAGTDRVIASPAAYLGGIVWKAPDKVNPAHTIQEIVQNYAEWVC